MWIVKTEISNLELDLSNEQKFYKKINEEVHESNIFYAESVYHNNINKYIEKYYNSDFINKLLGFGNFGVFDIYDLKKEKNTL